MRKFYILTLLILLPFFTIAQYNWDFGAHVGGAGYLGEIGGNAGKGKMFIGDLKLSKTRIAAGAFGRYKFTPLLSAKIGLNYVRIAGADAASINPGRKGRNLSFRNDIIELEINGQVFFYEIPDLGHSYSYRNDFKMYAFFGISAFYNNPKALYNGKWYALRPLQTEGRKYKAVAASIPLGLGFLFTLNKRHRIGWEFDWRTTFTDYLDDVSGNYATDAELDNDPLRIALANRRGELGNEGVPSAINYEPYSEYNGSVVTNGKRGDPKRNDSFITTSLYYSYVLRGKSSFYKSKYGSIFKSSKYKKRKIRAKF